MNRRLHRALPSGTSYAEVERDTRKQPPRSRPEIFEKYPDRARRPTQKNAGGGGAQKKRRPTIKRRRRFAGDRRRTPRHLSRRSTLKK